MSQRQSSLEYKINQLSQERRELVEILKREKKDYIQILPEEHQKELKVKHSVIKQRLKQIRKEVEELTEKLQNIVNEQIHDLSQSFDNIEMPLQRTPIRRSQLNIALNTPVVINTAEHTQANMQPTNVTQTTQKIFDSAANNTATMSQAQQNVELVTTSTVPTSQQNVETGATALDNPINSGDQTVEITTVPTGAILNEPNSKLVETTTIPTGAVPKKPTVEFATVITDSISQKSNNNPMREKEKNIQEGATCLDDEFLDLNMDPLSKREIERMMQEDFLEQERFQAQAKINQSPPERPRSLNLNTKHPDFVASEKMIRIATQNILSEMRNTAQRNISGSNVNDSLDLKRVQPLKAVSKINFVETDNDANYSPPREALAQQQNIQSTPNVNVDRQSYNAGNNMNSMPNRSKLIVDTQNRRDTMMQNEQTDFPTNLNRTYTIIQNAPTRSESVEIPILENEDSCYQIPYVQQANMQTNRTAQNQGMNRQTNFPNNPNAQMRNVPFKSSQSMTQRDSFRNSENRTERDDRRNENPNNNFNANPNNNNSNVSFGVSDSVVDNELKIRSVYLKRLNNIPEFDGETFENLK